MRKFRVIFGLAALGMTIMMAGAQSVPALVGTIAYIGNDHNVYVIDETFEPTALTSDATQTRRYVFPTWSTDGRLAFFCCDTVFADALALQTYVASPDLTAAKLLYEAQNEGYTYSYWSPANCADGPACRDLAVLVTQPNMPFKVELIRQNGTQTSTRSTDTGAPFYISWNQDGQRMLWYRNNARLSLFDTLEDIDASDLTVTPGGMQAPSWSPVDDRAAVMLLEPGGESTALVVVDGDAQRALVSAIPSSNRGYVNTTALSWSPDGRFIAYRVINRLGASPVFVIDSETGESVALTADLNVLAFFWSPDSSKIVYMTPGDALGGAGVHQQPVRYQPADIGFKWSALDVTANTTRLLAQFTPSPAMTYLLAYFDQFSQSHQLWSPDSRYFMYGEMLSGGSSSVTILDTNVAAPVPFTVADGQIGIWSYN